MSSEVGSGHVSVFPVMTGFKRRVRQEMGASGKAGASTFGSAFRGAGTKLGRALGIEAKAGFGAVDLVGPGLKRLQGDVAKAARELSSARMKQADEAGRLRAAEARLVEVQEKYPAGSAAVIAAEERVAAARRRTEAATTAAASASDRLKAAQTALAGVQKTTTTSLLSALGQLFKPLGSKISGWLSPVTSRLSGLAGVAKSAFSKMGDAIASPFRNVGSKISGWLAPVKTALGPVASALGGPIRNAMQGALGAVRSGFASMVRAAGQLPGQLANVLKGPATAVVGAAAAGLGLALTRGFSRLGSIDEAQAKLRGLGHDAESVGAIMTNATASVRGTAFGLDEAATTAAGAVAAGIKPGEQLERMLKGVANVAAATKTPMAEMGSIFNRVAANGKAYTQEINQLADRGLPIWQALADQLGVTTDEVRTMATEGKIGFQEFSDAAASAAGTAAEEMGKTVSGSWKNLLASIGRIGAGLLSGIYPLIAPLIQAVTGALGPIEGMAAKLGEAIGQKVAPVVESLIGMLGRLKDGGGLGDLGGVLGKLAPALGALGALGTGGLGGLLSKLPLLGGMAGPLSALGGPLGMVLGLLAGLVATSPELQAALGGLVQSVLPVLVSLFQQIGPPLLEAARTIGALLVPVIVQLVQAVAPLIAQLVSGLAPILGELITSVLPPLISVFAAVIPVVSQIIAALAPLIAMIISNLIPVIQALLPVVATVFGGIAAVIESVMGIIQSIIAAISAAISGDWDAFWGHLGEAVSAVFSDLIPTVLGFLGDLGSKLFEAGKNIVSQLIAGIKSMIGGVGDAIGSVVGKIAEFLPHSPAKRGPFSGAGWGGWGEAIADQLAGELHARVSMVERAASAIAGAAVPAADAAFGAAGGRGASFVQQNYITQSEDPDATSRFLGRRFEALAGGGVR